MISSYWLYFVTSTALFTNGAEYNKGYHYSISNTDGETLYLLLYQKSPTKIFGLIIRHLFQFLDVTILTSLVMFQILSNEWEVS